MLADARDLALRDAVAAQRLHEVLDAARGDAFDVGLLDDGEQRLLGSPAWVQERRQVGARTQLRDLQVERAGARVPAPRAVAVAIVGAVRRALVQVGADPLTDVGIHDGVQDDLQRLPQEVDVCLTGVLADDVESVHGRGGHRDPPCVLGDAVTRG